MEADTSNGERRIVIEQRSGSGLSTFFVGLAVGAGVALLLAPASGARTRRRLRRQARRAAQAVEHIAGDLLEDVAGTVDEARTRVEDTISTARRAVVERVMQPPLRRGKPDV